MDCNLTARIRQINAAGKIAFIPEVVYGWPSPEESLSVLSLLSHYDNVILKTSLPASEQWCNNSSAEMISINRHAWQLGLRNNDVARIFRQQQLPSTLVVYPGIALQYSFTELIDILAGAFDCLTLAEGYTAKDSAWTAFGHSFREYQQIAEAGGIALANVVTEKHTDDELVERVETSSGFIYTAVSTAVAGLTHSDFQIEELLARIRRYTDLPIQIGFGVRGPDMIRRFTKFQEVNAITMGTQLVREQQKGCHHFISFIEACVAACQRPMETECTFTAARVMPSL